MSGLVPSPALQPIRALEVFSTVPAGHTLHPQRDDAHAPHIRAGEFAVIDPTDREPEHGELFLIEFGRNSHAGPRATIMQTWCKWYEYIGQPRKSPDEPVVMGPGYAWMMLPLNRCRSAEEAMARIRRGLPVYGGRRPLLCRLPPNHHRRAGDRRL